MQSQPVHVDLSDWRTMRQWVAEKGGSIFKSYSSFEWFIRKHRAELVASGEYIPRPGASGSLCGPGLATKVLEIIRDEAQKAEDLQNAPAPATEPDGVVELGGKKETVPAVPPEAVADPEGVVELSVWMKPSEADALRAMASARGSAANDLAEEPVRDALERIREGGQL